MTWAFDYRVIRAFLFSWNGRLTIASLIGGVLGLMLHEEQAIL
jgi:hypothetical protein